MRELTIFGAIRLWEVYVFAFLLGTAAAFDAPARQTFVSELVGPSHLANAVALNSMTFNGARMIGPAVAGLLIATVGTGWAFLANGASFVAVLLSLTFLRVKELIPNERAPRRRGGFKEGLVYVWGRPDLRAAWNSSRYGFCALSSTGRRKAPGRNRARINRIA